MRDQVWDPLEEGVRSLKEEDLKKGVPPGKEFQCRRCQKMKMCAGSKKYGDIALCNDCVLVYARALFAETDLGIEAFMSRPLGKKEPVHVEPEEQIVEMLKQLHKFTTHDAKILAGSLNPLNTDDPIHLKYHQINRERNRPPGFVRIRVKYKDVVGDWSNLWLTTPEEMVALAGKGGWQLEEILHIEGDSHYVGILTKS